MLLLAFSVIGFLKMLLMVVFILSALLLLLVVLLQEPKGGGLSSAFGGAGAETFGVQTGSVNRFTAWVAAIFMSSALFYAAIRPGEEDLLTQAPGISQPADPLGGQPAEGGQPAGENVEKDK
jgi:preprotein translocase subunit SecG